MIIVCINIYVSINFMHMYYGSVRDDGLEHIVVKYSQ